MYMGTKNVLSIGHFIEDENLAKEIFLSDYIRNETLHRLTALPSYNCKSLKWKNRYYDYFKNQVMKELASV